MQQRRSASGRPSGTDGSDYSYRMVVDSRYTKVAKRKTRLSQICLIQGLIVLADIFLISLPVIKGEDPNVLAISSAAVSFISLIIGESGRRHSRAALLKIYLILSIVALLLSVACAVKSDLLLEAFRSGLASSTEKQRVQIMEGVRIFVGLLVQIFAASTTLSLIHNMAPPKRSS